MAAKCPCCKQSSRLRKVECSCGNVAWQSRVMIERGAIDCPCGFPMLPVCLLDRQRQGDRDAGMRFDHKYPSKPDPTFSRRASKGAATRKFRAACAAIPVASDPIPF